MTICTHMHIFPSFVYLEGPEGQNPNSNKKGLQWPNLEQTENQNNNDRNLVESID